MIHTHGADTEAGTGFYTGSELGSVALAGGKITVNRIAGTSTVALPAFSAGLVEAEEWIQCIERTIPGVDGVAEDYEIVVRRETTPRLSLEMRYVVRGGIFRLVYEHASHEVTAYPHPEIEMGYPTYRRLLATARQFCQRAAGIEGDTG